METLSYNTRQLFTGREIHTMTRVSHRPLDMIEGGLYSCCCLSQLLYPTLDRDALDVMSYMDDALSKLILREIDVQL